MKKFSSIKNRFEIDLDNHIITKCFSKSEDFSKEKQIYQRNLQFIPKLINIDESEMKISIQNIIGSTIIEMQPDFRKIANLFLQLHQIEKNTICLMDTNPKNILFEKKTGSYYLIDFSDWEYREKEFDLIHFLLFWASIYNFEIFNLAASNFLLEYDGKLSISRKDWKQKVEDVIKIFDERRKKYNRKEKILDADTGKNRDFLFRFFG